jgi:hypothetical protein
MARKARPATQPSNWKEFSITAKLSKRLLALDGSITMNLVSREGLRTAAILAAAPLTRGDCRTFMSRQSSAADRGHSGRSTSHPEETVELSRLAIQARLLRRARARSVWIAAPQRWLEIAAAMPQQI